MSEKTTKTNVSNEEVSVSANLASAKSSLDDLADAKTNKGDLADSSLLSEADVKFDALLDEELRKKMVDDEVARRMLAHRQGAGAVNTDNPYNVKAGEKVTYIVNGEVVDANGNSVASK